MPHRSQSDPFKIWITSFPFAFQLTNSNLKSSGWSQSSHLYDLIYHPLCFIPLQPPWPLCSSLNAPKMILPQSLCTCCASLQSRGLVLISLDLCSNAIIIKEAFKNSNTILSLSLSPLQCLNFFHSRYLITVFLPNQNLSFNRAGTLPVLLTRTPSICNI